MLKQFLRTLLIPVPKNAVYWEENSNPKVQEIKPELFLPALAAAVPRFHFPSLLSRFHCSCCFSCCSVSLSSCRSPPAERVRVPIPLRLKAAFLLFACSAEVKRPLHCLSPVIPLFFLVHHSYAQCPLLSFWDHTGFPSFGERLNARFSRIFTCWTSIMLRTQLTRKAVQEAFIFLELEPGASRGRRWAGLRLIICKVAMAEQVISEGLLQAEAICTLRSELKPMSL